MLAKKQNIKDNADWIRALNNSVSICSFEEIKELEQKTINRIRRVATNYNNICSGWIAGKDSIVVNNILLKSGINFKPIMWRGINEYPEMKKWVDANKPNNLIEEVIDKYTLEYLEKHPDYLFCKNNTRQRWMATKWERQRKDIAKYNFDLFITGRRLKDGNQCGNEDNEFIVNKKGYDVFSPIGEWSHEQLLAYIRYNNIELPPFYQYDRGFLIGSIAQGEWTERAVLDKTENEVWEELYQIDKSIVIDASKKLTSAKKFLEAKNEDRSY